MATKTETLLNNLKINYLTKEQYDTALENNEINENEIYMTPSREERSSLEIVINNMSGYDHLTKATMADITVLNTMPELNEIRDKIRNNQKVGCNIYLVEDWSSGGMYYENICATNIGAWNGGIHVDFIASDESDMDNERYSMQISFNGTWDEDYSKYTFENIESISVKHYPYNFISVGTNYMNSIDSMAIGSGNTISSRESLAVGYYNTVNGTAASVFGEHCESTGWGSHAEGRYTKATEDSSHAEGYYTTASGEYSHAEGYNTVASGDGSHAEGGNRNSNTNGDLSQRTITLSDGSIVTIEGSVAAGIHSHAEGIQTYAESYSSHTEGYRTVATSDESVEPSTNSFTGHSAQHAEGIGSVAIGTASHAEGDNTLALGEYSHAEGTRTKATGDSSHAEGNFTYATSSFSHAEGSQTSASGYSSHAEGWQTKASGQYSHAEGNNTKALDYQHAQGHYNNTSSATAGDSSGTNGTAFVIGNGTSSTASNACRITYAGAVIGKAAYSTSGADYAEYFEWADANVDNEERVGYFVTFEDGRFIRKANENDYILGIVSGNPAVLGNHDECWMGQNEMDEWGRFIYETKTEVNEETKEEYTYTTYKVNPNYDRSKQYIPRAERPEWAAIGMLGVLAVRDDGTCQVNGYCKVADGGIATASDTGYRVIERVTDNIIKVVFR